THPRKDSLPATALAQVRLIGPKLSDALKARGVQTVDELHLRTRSLGDRETLALELGIARSLIDQWDTVLRLRTLRGATVTSAVAELLFEVGLRDPGALAQKNPKEFADELRSMNDASQLLDLPPSED